MKKLVGLNTLVAILAMAGIMILATDLNAGSIESFRGNTSEELGEKTGLKPVVQLCELTITSAVYRTVNIRYVREGRDCLMGGISITMKAENGDSNGTK